MHNQELFITAFVYLCAAAICVPIAKKFGLSSVLGYLVAGVAIGRFGMGLVGQEGQDVMYFAEFGVVMMLFLVGLELQPSLLWKLRAPILGLGGLQVLVSTLAVTAIAYFGFDQQWKTSLAIGLTLALSSTAIVLQNLNEKGLMKTQGGQSSFSVLLFQDIAVIPILALLPFLATIEKTGDEGHESHGVQAWVEHLPAWSRALLVLGAVAVIILAGRTVVRWILHVIGKTRVRETFTAFALILVIGTALLMNMLGVSPALGAFLAGVVLATSEYRHELESDIEPFKGLLLGVFFIAVGAGIDFSLIAAKPILIGTLVVLLMLVKGIVLFLLGKVFGLSCDQRFLFAFSLAQAGEFCFVVLGFGAQNGVFGDETAQILIATVALTMGMTPLAMMVEEKFLRNRCGTTESEKRPPDEMEEHGQVILAGFGRFGNHVGRFLISQGVEVTVLDHDSDHIDFLRKIGIKAFYGDASRVDLLEAAGAREAKILIIALADKERTDAIIESTQKHFPHLKIMARAVDRVAVYKMTNQECVQAVVHEHSHSSVELGVLTLQELGERSFKVRRAALEFLRHDQESIVKLAENYEDENQYISAIRERLASMEELFGDESDHNKSEARRAWDNESIREDVKNL